MSKFLSREDLRTLDRRAIEEFGVPGVVLMENAGRGAAEILFGLDVRGPVVVCCGKGNNGGDGFVIARHLDNHNIPARVHLFGAPEALAGDAAVMYEIIQRSGLPIRVHAGDKVDEEALKREFASADWIVDALFGTGLSGAARSPFDRIIALMNESNRRVLGVDIPSGLDCDTGKPLGPTVKASVTATFVAMKKGYADPAAKQWLGQIQVVDIGAPRCLIEGCGRTDA